MALFAVNVVQSRSHVLADAQDRQERRVAVLAEHAARVFDGYGLIFDLMDHQFAGMDDRALAGDEGAIGHLRDLLGRTAPGDGSLQITDSHGKVLISSAGQSLVGRDRSDRDYFIRARQSAGMIVGEQIVGRVKGRRMFSLGRKAANERVYTAQILTSYFEENFAQLVEQDGDDVTVALFRDDGRQLVRYPALAEPVNLTPGKPGLMEHIPHSSSGVFRTVPLSGGEEKQFAYSQVPGYPVYVSFGVTLSTLMADWYRAVAMSGLVALATSLLLGGITLHAIRRADEAARTERALAAAVTSRTAELTEAVKEREIALAVAERANAGKAHFMAAASHDLRQPIQGLRLFLEVLDGRLLVEENRRVLGMAKKALEGAEDLLSTLLDVSTLEAGMVRPTLRPVPAAEVLDQLAEEFRRQAQTRSLALRYVPCSLNLDTDPVLLARLLRNLLTNATRYTQQGGILLGCRRQGGMVSIQVWDTGPGIPPDKQDSVFEDFVQLGNPERDRSKGLGLGLAVVRRMARLMGHTVSICSVVGKGTMFAVSVPISQTTPAALEASLA